MTDRPDRELALEGGDLRSSDERGGREDIGESGEHLVGNVAMLRAEVDQGNRLGRGHGSPSGGVDDRAQLGSSTIVG